LLDSQPRADPQQVRRILFASLVGTTVEFFDFYIYATAAILVFPRLFFPRGDPTTATLQSLATFALAFFARPVGSALFGHFGDRVGRKATLVTALLTMGVSTVCVGLLPTYASIGVLAPALLALCRLGQGLGLGGEWGGAVLLATENAPPRKQAWYGCFPQLGAPLGFMCSTGVFLLLSNVLDEESFLTWGWRVPFLASAVLVAVGLYVRLQLVETPAFKRSLAQGETVRVPFAVVFARKFPELILGALIATAIFTIFYLMTVFALGWATDRLGFGRQEFLLLQMAGVVCFGLTIPISAIAADRIGERTMVSAAIALIVVFGFCFAPLFGSHDTARVLIFLAAGFGFCGLAYGPLGSALAKLFPTPLRYTGTSIAFNLAGILGAAPAPFTAWLARHYGVGCVGYYLAAVGIVSLVAMRLVRPDDGRGLF
jgi:metabolite-proton symporter